MIAVLACTGPRQIRYVSTVILGDPGIAHLGVSEEGTVFASRDPWQEPNEYQYVSHDGGLNWIEESTGPKGIKGTPGLANTPHGRFEVDQEGVYRLVGGRRVELAYSTAHLRNPGNTWTQEKTSGGAVTGPLDVVYEPISGNVIVAMGRQGVAVRTPDGKWTRHIVGPYSPTDFSFTGKTRLLLSDGDFWVMALALLLSFAGAALVYSQHDPDGSKLQIYARVLIAGAAMVLSLAMLIQFGGSNPTDVPASFDWLAISTFILGVAAIASSLKPPRYWLTIGAFLGGMLFLIVLLFMVWLHAGIVLVAAKTSTIVLTAIWALLLGYRLQAAEFRRPAGLTLKRDWLAYLTKSQTVGSGPIRCRHCQQPNHPAAQDCNSCGLPVRH